METEKKGYKQLVSLSSSKNIHTINDDDRNKKQVLDYAILTHNPYQKNVKNPPIVTGKK